LTEAVTNVGYGVGVVMQIVLFPVFGFTVTLGQNRVIGLVFKAASIVRSYALRRLFEMLARS
jgi:hypothetical protein